MTIFDFDSYKNYLKALVNNNKRGMITKLAEAAGCQRSYLSQSLSSQINLTSDQIYNISLYLGLSDHEQDYALLLLEKEKAGTVQYKNKIKKRLKTIKADAKRISKKIKSEKLKQIDPKYYSAWYYSAIHISTSIENLNTEEDFAKFFNLSKTLVREVLNDLQSWGFVSSCDEAWQYNSMYNLHLDDASFLNRMNHNNWRTFILSQAIQPEKNINYTSVFTVSTADKKKIRENLLKFIDEQRSIISASGTNDLISFSCDFFDFSC